LQGNLLQLDSETKIVLYLFLSNFLGWGIAMRKPDTIEKLYLDFDGFFASAQ